MKTVLSLIDRALTALAAVPQTPYAVALRAQLKACASNCAAHIAADVATAATKAATALTPQPPSAPPSPGGEGRGEGGPPPASPANPKVTTKSVLGALAVLFASFVLFVGSVSAQSFNTTNVLSAQSATANTILSGYPTNSIGTNTLGQGVGGAVSVANNEFALLTCSMFVCTNVAGGTPTTNNIMLQLIRSGTSGPPSLGQGTNLFTTNVTNIIVQPWETYSNTVPALSQITIPVTTTFGTVTWSTNLPQAYVSGANWLGIGQIYVNATNFFATNFAVTLSKKIIPIRYP